MEQSEIERFIDAIPETEAFYALNLLKRRFGWSGTMFSISDAGEAIFTTAEWKNIELETGQADKLTDELMESYAWTKALEDRLCEIGWNMLMDEAAELIQEI